eukprot:TRINITY_DN9376_c0_g1_i4.p1 TRINITY_DN9376_c0_g1~~TRINITY_DN9376_c0_g1_i4.p1  ORF type:complete len:462 (-),score=101.90 TRINITY_DN9376_c0_g1_i4:12-1397(-)
MSTAETPQTFTKLGVAPWLVQNLAAVGIKKPTPIQLQCIPPALKGRDVIGSAQTGSGKTAAFAVPILQSLAEDPYGIYALVLTPTRELAVQIAEQFNVFGKTMGLRVAVIIGGLDALKQATDIRQKPHIVIATPGRLVDIMNREESVSLKRIKYLVLDEADRLLDKKFEESLAQIFEMLPEKRQTLLFSATMTTSIERLQEICMENTVRVEVNPRSSTVDTLAEEYIFIPASVKECYLTHILQKYEKASIIIFVSTCFASQHLNDTLKLLGFRTTCMHSVLSQPERLASLAKFKSGIVSILIATDVASRGLDIPVVELVLNYDVPFDPSNYVHRVGRTARAGRAGRAITFITEHDIKLVHRIESTINKKLSLHETNENQVLKVLTKVTKASKTAKLNLEESGFGEDRKRQRMLEAQRQQMEQELDEEEQQEEEETQTKKKKSRKYEQAPVQSEKRTKKQAK